VNGLAVRIDALLPQTQCTRCGYPTCRAYAEAIAADAADIDRCPPGGAEGVAALAALLGRTAKALDRAFGVEAPPTLAFIDEDTCIGCTKCIQACPVDAIVGAGKHMHTVIAAECTGCELCLPPCPVDCIVLVPTAPTPLARVDILRRASAARARFEARNQRLANPGTRLPRSPQPSALSPRAESGSAPPPATPLTRSAVLEAIARGKARRAGKSPTSR
jgi:Na+-translocating ferredoxin:NAD+ oxidoreductase subunit B